MSLFASFDTGLSTCILLVCSILHVANLDTSMGAGEKFVTDDLTSTFRREQLELLSATYLCLGEMNLTFYG